MGLNINAAGSEIQQYPAQNQPVQQREQVSVSEEPPPEAQEASPPPETEEPPPPPPPEDESVGNNIDMLA